MKIKREVKIGIYVVVTLALLYWTVNFLKGRNIFGKESTYYTVTESVQGLQASSHVYLRGLKIGYIDKIKLDESETSFRVRMKVNSKYKFPENSKAVIYSSDIMGTKAIKIELSNSTNVMNEGETMSSSIESDLSNIIVNNLGSIRDKSDTLLTQLNATFRTINTILDEKGTAEIKTSIENVSKITEDFRKSATALNSMLETNKDKFGKIIDNSSQISESMRTNLANVDTILLNFKDASAKVQEIDIDRLSSSLNELLTAINNKEGSLGMLIYNDSLYSQLTESAKNLQLLLEDIKAHPKRYINFSVFGKKDKSKN